jgi:hypothetical protein
MRYYFYAVAAMIGMMFGIGMIENPSFNLLYGTGVLYLSVSVLCYSLVRLTTRKHGY